MKERIIGLALLFAEIHIDDSDCLGKVAQELCGLIKKEYPHIKEPPEDIDC